MIPNDDPAAPSADDETPEGLDPLTDLFFTVAAVVLAILIALVPTIEAARRVNAPPETVAERLTTGDVTLVHDGRPVLPALARAAGIEIGGRRVPPDALPDDAELASVLARATASGETVLLVIAPDGLDTAFLFDGIAARAGVTRLWQIRLDALCGFAAGTAGAGLCRP